MTNITASQIKVSGDGFVFVNGQCEAYIRTNNFQRHISLRSGKTGVNQQALPPRTWTNTASLNEFCANYINAQA